MKTSIVIITYNTPIEVLLLQLDAIDKFCQDKPQIVIVDNSYDSQLAIAIKHQVDIRENIKYFKTSASSRNGSDSHAFAAAFAMEKLKGKFDYYFYLDHDCIPVKTFSIPEILKEKVAAGLGQGNPIPYFWAGCFMYDATKIDIDFNMSYSHDLHLDTGGGTHKIIETYGKDKCVFFNEEYKQNPGFTKSNETAYAMINDGMFFHMVNASNWKQGEHHNERINSLVNIAREMINQN